MAYIPTPKLANFLKKLPKTETHLHNEGALPFELIKAKHPGKYVELPKSWQADFKFKNFAQFESELIGMACDWFTSPIAYFESSSIVFQRLYEEQNVKYIETSFASGMIEFLNLDGSKVAEAIKSAAHPKQTVQVFMGIHHDGYTDQSRKFLDECHRWDALDGIDLHGMETVPLGDWTVPFWKRAADNGLRLKAHAGEFCGPEFIEWVIDHLGIRRIQHGVRAVESDALVKRLKAERILLDVCPISNIKLDVVPSMKSHPIRKLMEAGVICTINTDDPISFGNQLYEEYTALHQELDFTFAELGALAKNGFRHSVLDEAEINSTITEIDQLVASY